LAPSETSIEPLFTQQAKDEDLEEPYYFDPSDKMSKRNQRGRAFHLSINYDQFLCKAEVNSFLNGLDNEELLGYNEPIDTFAFALQAKATIPDAVKLQPYLAWHPLEVIQRTLEHTTQLAHVRHDRALQTHYKPWFPWLNRNRLHETVATDTMFASICNISGATCAQIYWGLTSHFINVYGMRTESKGPRTLDDFA